LRCVAIRVIDLYFHAPEVSERPRAPDPHPPQLVAAIAVEPQTPKCTLQLLAPGSWLLAPGSWLLAPGSAIWDAFVSKRHHPRTRYLRAPSLGLDPHVPSRPHPARMTIQDLKCRLAASRLAPHVLDTYIDQISVRAYLTLLFHTSIRGGRGTASSRRRRTTHHAPRIARGDWTLRTTYCRVALTCAPPRG
jgi:hypothetical protein